MRVVDVLMLVCVCGARACRWPVRISGVAGDTWSFHSQLSGNILVTNYGNIVNIICTSDDAKKLRVAGQGVYPGLKIFGIEYDDTAPPAPSGELIEVSETTLEMSVELGIGWYDYTCTDVETTCVAQLQVRVLPIVTVVSPNLRQKSFPSGVFHYFVPIDEDFELFCYGNGELEIGGRSVETISVNETTVKSKKLRAIEYSIHVYYCRHRASRVTTRNLEIHFDYLPAATCLWCTEYDWQINCSWRVLGTDTTFTLFYTDKNENSVRVYEEFTGRKNKKTRSCEWNLGDMQLIHGLAISDNIKLIIQACNNIYCSNQTHIIGRKSIIKTGSPRDLELSRTSSHSAVVTWRGPITPYFDNVPVEYKVIYLLPGMKDLNGSSSRYTCDQRAFAYLVKCEAELNLPCPGALYEVQVYVKFTTTPRDDAYWSEPARVSFRTDPRTSSDTVDPACLKEPELIDNKYVAVYEVRKLRRSSAKEGSALQVKVKSLEHKLEKIKEICRELTLDDCEDSVLR